MWKVAQKREERRGIYEFFLDDQRREKVNNEKGLKRNLTQEEIDMVKAKKLMLKKAVVSLSQDANKYAMDAENKFNVMEMKELITKSSSF